MSPLRKKKMTVGWVVDGERRHAGQQRKLVPATIGKKETPSDASYVVQNAAAMEHQKGS